LQSGFEIVSNFFENPFLRSGEFKGEVIVVEIVEMGANMIENQPFIVSVSEAFEQ
jgi:hypothetical protein